jgi:hypothetical protein
MQNQNKDYNKQMDAENNKQQEELEVAARTKAGGMITRELVKKGEEIAKEFVTPKSGD